MVSLSYDENRVELDKDYCFADWRHFLGHFGDILPFTVSRIHITTYEGPR